MSCTPDDPAQTVDPTAAPIGAYDPLPWVDPMVGTDGLGAQVAAVTPAASAPLGMVLVGPNTRNTSTGDLGIYHMSGYHYTDDLVEGFAHTHAHGIGINDYGAVHVMPRAQWDDRYTRDRGRAAPFEHDREWATPGRYQVDLLDDGTHVDIVASTRSALHTYTFEAGAEPLVLIDLGHTLGNVEVAEAELDIDVENASWTGFQRLNGGYSSRFGGLQTHFVAQFDPAPVSSGTWSDWDTVLPDTASVTGVESGGWVRFPEGTTTVQMRLAISYVDLGGARENLRVEQPDWDGDARLTEVEDVWREQLSRVRVQGGTDAQKTTFHTAVYHSLLMPSRFTDVDGRYRGMDGEVHTADFDYLTDLSLWDTFRTLHPFWTLAYPEHQRATLNSLIRMQADGGSLPRWPMAHGYTGGMVGSPAQHLFAESYLKGLDGWDSAAAFNASYPASIGPQTSAGRAGIEAYVDVGMVTFEASNQPASKTLEYAWADNSMGLWAEAMGLTEESTELFDLSRSWQNTYSSEFSFFIGHYEDGSVEWDEDISLRWTNDYTEGNAWHYVWGVPYDVDGLIDLQHGGDRDAFMERLSTYWDNVYDEEDDLLPDDYYWHGNEPVMHYAYLGSLAGNRELSAEAARWVMANRYNETPLGLDGNDDSGTLSAWFVLSAMGIFPIAGTDTYAFGSPLFDRVEIDREDGSMWVVRAPGVSEDAKYIETARFDDEVVEGGTITHDQWENADALILEMSAER